MVKAARPRVPCAVTWPACVPGSVPWAAGVETRPHAQHLLGVFQTFTRWAVVSSFTGVELHLRGNRHLLKVGILCNFKPYNIFHCIPIVYPPPRILTSVLLPLLNSELAWN